VNVDKSHWIDRTLEWWRVHSDMVVWQGCVFLMGVITGVALTGGLR
jgi:hypothetical protein